MQRVVFYSVLIIIVLFLSSCIGIDSEIAFSKDGSGIIKMEYRISNSFTEMNSEGGTPPLPLTEEALRAALKDSTSLELVDTKQRKDEKDTYMSATIKFKAIEALTSLEAFSSMPMSLSKNGSTYRFEQLISEGSVTTDEEDLSMPPDEEEALSSEELPSGESTDDSNVYSDEEIQAMMAPYFEGYELSFEVKAPSTITSHNLGVLSQDKKSVTYSIPLLDLQNLEKKTSLIVEWNG